MKNIFENILSFISDGFTLSNFIVILLLIFFLILFSRFFKYILIKLNKLELDLKEEIKSSVKTKFIETSMETEHLINLAIEVWRIDRRLNKSIKHLDDKNRKALEISIQKIKRIIDKYDLEIRDYTSQKYNSGLTALEVVSVERDKSTKADIIKETLEPAILIRGQLIKKAKVILLTKK
ncbi:hypothetical protein ACFL25_00775 [Patescibacteria group bacterium]